MAHGIQDHVWIQRKWLMTVKESANFKEEFTKTSRITGINVGRGLDSLPSHHHIALTYDQAAGRVLRGSYQTSISILAGPLLNTCSTNMEDQTTTNALDNLDSLKKFDKLWFDDADVVFCAGNSKFRVYRGLLCAHSIIFRDMFSLPQTDGGNLKAGDDTFSVITLPDAEEDVYYFFLALFYPSFYGPPPLEFSLSVNISILRLSHKYEVPFLVLWAFSHLEDYFPMDMNRFPTANWRIRTPEERALFLTQCLDILPLLDKLGLLQWIIPSVLCTLMVCYEIDKIVKNPSFGQLSCRHQLLIIKSEANRAMEKLSTNSWVGRLPSDFCTMPENCRRISRAVHERDEKCLPDDLFCFDGAERILFPERGTRVLCNRCQEAGKIYTEALKQKFTNQYWKIGGFADCEEAGAIRKKAIKELKKGLANFTI